ALLHHQQHRVGAVRCPNADPLPDAAELHPLQPVDLHGAHPGSPSTVIAAPVASGTRAAPKSPPGVQAPGATPARTRRVVSAAMAAVARTPSPTRSSAVRVCPSGPVASAHAKESVPPVRARGS